MMTSGAEASKIGSAAQRRRIAASSSLNATPLLRPLSRASRSRRATTIERNPVTGQPIGTLLGVAVQDIVTGQRINAYVDPQGRLFYASFTPESPA